MALHLGVFGVGGLMFPWFAWFPSLAEWIQKHGATPVWVSLAAFLGAPWCIALLSLLQGRRRLAFRQSVSLCIGSCIGIALILGCCFWATTRIFDRGRHPFPNSLAQAEAAGVRWIAPLDPNDWGLRGEKIPKPPEDGAERQGATEVVLWKGRQEGIFSAWIWANPGEPGHLFLRIREHATLQPISEGASLARRNISEATRHEARFSDDSSHVFFSKVAFTVHGQGGWEHFFAGRVELWFQPANGEPERRLWEQVYRLNFWQR